MAGLRLPPLMRLSFSDIHFLLDLPVHAPFAFLYRHGARSAVKALFFIEMIGFCTDDLQFSEIYAIIRISAADSHQRK